MQHFQASMLLSQFDKLVQETAYEHWHRMLFARFLAENDLLMHPGGAPLSPAPCACEARRACR